jgi:GntR family transcriptional repressor for pyruvate dehydrogenase complex
MNLTISHPKYGLDKKENTGKLSLTSDHHTTRPSPISMYTPIQSGRLYEKIVEQIEQRILSGELKAGDRLPAERELCEQFGVSRTAVREAVRALNEKGLVDVQPGRGTFITNGSSRAMRYSLDMLVKFDPAKGSSNLAEVREMFEPEIAALAAARASTEQIAAMRDAVATMDAALDNAEVFIESDLDFHLAMAEATQNAIMPMLIDSIVDLLREQRKRISLTAGGLERGQFHHKQILDAVVRHDPDAARAAMRAHLQQVKQDSEASSVSAK